MRLLFYLFVFMKRSVFFTSLVSIFLLLSGFFMPSSVTAYSDTNNYGCYTCWSNCENIGRSYGEYYCPNQNAYYNNSNYGYNTNYNYNYRSPLQTCIDMYGQNAAADANGNCGCLKGYELGTNNAGYRSCVPARSCSDIYGSNAVKNSDGNCVCVNGTTMNTNTNGERSCTRTVRCGIYGPFATTNYDGTCGCAIGYKMGTNSQGYVACVKVRSCVEMYGSNAVENYNGSCGCAAGYQWSNDRVRCETIPNYNNQYYSNNNYVNNNYNNDYTYNTRRKLPRVTQPPVRNTVPNNGAKCKAGYVPMDGFCVKYQ